MVRFFRFQEDAMEFPSDQDREKNFRSVQSVPPDEARTVPKPKDPRAERLILAMMADPEVAIMELDGTEPPGF